MTHAVVDRDEGTFGAHCGLYRALLRLRGLKVWRDGGRRKVGEGQDMSFRDQENVARKQGAVIQEGQGSGAAPNDIGGNRSGRDLAEYAAHPKSNCDRFIGTPRIRPAHEPV